MLKLVGISIVENVCIPYWEIYCHVSCTFELCLAIDLPDGSLSTYTNRTTYSDYGIIDVTSVLLDFQDLSQPMNNSFVCCNICIAYRSIIYK